MKSFFARLFSAILLVMILAALPGMTLASDFKPSINPLGDYTALGDSIASGYGDAAGGGYVGRIHGFLADNVRTFNLKLNNFGAVGNTSSNLLKSLKEDQKIRQALKKSRFVTISIGGNNLLNPVIAAVSKTFNVDTVDTNRLADEIEKAFKNDPDFFYKLVKLMRPDGIPAELEKGVEQFRDDWPEIIRQIREIAPEAKVYVMTLFNPVQPDNPFYLVFDRAVNGINGIIKAGANNKAGDTGNSAKADEDMEGGNAYKIGKPDNFSEADKMVNDRKDNYTVIDIYSKFINYKGDRPLTGFNLFGGSLDPHPTPEGYELIFQSHLPELEKDLSEGSEELVSRADSILYLLRIFGIDEPLESLIEKESADKPSEEKSSDEYSNKPVNESLKDLIMKHLSEIMDNHGNSNFYDVKPQDYYFNAVDTARRLGIAKGVGANRFLPDVAVTRQDFMVFAGRLIEKLELPRERVSVAYLGRYDDSGWISVYARNHVAMILGNGLFELENNRIEPYRSMTKGELFEFLERLIVKYKLKN